MKEIETFGITIMITNYSQKWINLLIYLSIQMFHCSNNSVRISWRCKYFSQKVDSFLSTKDVIILFHMRFFIYTQSILHLLSCNTKLYVFYYDEIFIDRGSQRAVWI
jgi:hypothetical protein